MVDGFINFNLNEKTPTIIKVIGVGGGGGGHCHSCNSS